MIEDQPDLTTSSNNTTDASGLYKSTDTNSGSPTYYFRGNVENNYVDFAEFTWRVVRINEDGTVRLIMTKSIDDSSYSFRTMYNDKTYMYYSNSNRAKSLLETWYETNITDKGYSDKTATNNYFCEQAKVAPSSDFVTDSDADMQIYNDGYIPNFTCSEDANGYGIVNSSVGFITYDEVIHAGGYYNQSNSNYYLYISNVDFWMMSPAGFPSGVAREWSVNTSGSISYSNVRDGNYIRPVINLKADVTATGSGTSTDPYVVK